MCILLYVKLIWCSGIPQIYGQLEEGSLVYVHYAICETYVVQWYSIDLWSIGGVYICPGYSCILLYVKLDLSVVVFHRSMVNWRRGALVYVHSAICETYVVQWYSIDLWSLEGVHLPQVYVHSAICETDLVQWYSIDLWSIGVGGPWYVCILLYVKLIWCSGIPFIYG